MIKRFEELNYYEMLDIPVDASPYEIRQAYREAQSLYDGNALTTYALFEEKEREAILERIEEAFRTLIDEEKREAYKRKLIERGEFEDSKVGNKEVRRSIPIFPDGVSDDKTGLLGRIKSKIREKGAGIDFDGILSKDMIAGADLKGVREALGIDLQDVFEVTRVGISTLTAIEEDHFEKLPPKVFLKGFLRSYAELFNLDPEAIIQGYIRNLERSRDAH